MAYTLKGTTEGKETSTLHEPSIFNDKAVGISTLNRLNDQINLSVVNVGLAASAYKSLETYRSSINGLMGPGGVIDDYNKRLDESVGSFGLDLVRSQANKQSLDAEILRRPEMPPVPPNPIHETNKLLTKLTNKFEGLTILMTTMVDVEGKQAEAVSELLQSSRESLSAANASAAEQKAIAKRNLNIAVFGVVVAIVFGFIALFKI